MHIHIPGAPNSPFYMKVAPTQLGTKGGVTCIFGALGYLGATASQNSSAMPLLPAPGETAVDSIQQFGSLRRFISHFVVLPWQSSWM